MPPEARDDQENGLPWAQHSQQQQQTQKQQQQQQQQEQHEPSFRPTPGCAPASAGRHRLAQGTQNDHQWFAATAGSQPLQLGLSQQAGPASQQQAPHQPGPSHHPQQPGQLHLALSQQLQPSQQAGLSQPGLTSQPAPADAPFGCSQQSLSLAHYFWPSQPISDARGSAGGCVSGTLVGSLGDGVGFGFGSQLLEETVDQPPSSPPRGVECGSPPGMEEAGSGSGGLAAALLGRRGGASGSDDMCTPVTGWEVRMTAAGTTQRGQQCRVEGSRQEEPAACREACAQQQQQQQQQQQEPLPPSGDPWLHRRWGPDGPSPPMPSSSPRGRRPLDGLTSDSGSRAGPIFTGAGSGCGKGGAGGGACTPLSEDDFVLKASQSYTRALAVTSPVLPGAFAAAGGECEDGGRGRGGQMDYHTPLHICSQVGSGSGRGQFT
jgi:hypothetical protein